MTRSRENGRFHGVMSTWARDVRRYGWGPWER
jgi:hypothetical protein